LNAMQPGTVGEAPPHTMPTTGFGDGASPASLHPREWDAARDDRTIRSPRGGRRLLLGGGA
jgi:hypothetical protein